MEEVIIDVKGIAKHFPGVVALDDDIAELRVRLLDRVLDGRDGLFLGHEVGESEEASLKHGVRALAQSGFRGYRDIVRQDPDFVPYFRAATPMVDWFDRTDAKRPRHDKYQSSHPRSPGCAIAGSRLMRSSSRTKPCSPDRSFSAIPTATVFRSSSAESAVDE